MSLLKAAFAAVVLASGLTVSAFAANPQAEMKIAKRGTIVIELRPDWAPKTVAHFVELANKKFYDGILFHRYVEGFVVQGGDPNSKKFTTAELSDLTASGVAAKAREMKLGEGGSGKNVPLEGKGSHTLGTVGLARSQAEDSGDSQFFFNIADNTRLDVQYCAFGKVVKGEDVMMKLRQGDKIESVRILKAKSETKKTKK